MNAADGSNAQALGYTSRYGLDWGTHSNVLPPDTTLPVITVPQDITKEATSPQGSLVTFVVDAQDNVDGEATLNVDNTPIQDNVGGSINLSCEPASSSTFPIGNTTVTCNATDAAGNKGTASFTITVQDTTPPIITVNPVTYHGKSFSYANDQQFYYGDVPPKPTCTAEDTASDVDTNYGCQVAGYSTSVGLHTLTFTAKDKAGNLATKQISYEVLPWTIKGFYSPVKMTRINSVIRGSVVPLKFEVFAGSTELKVPSTVVASLTSTKVDCSTGAKLGSPQPLTPQSGTSLRYDTRTGQFIFYWRTPSQSNTCYDV